ncbi:MAG: TIGR04211 family SH3 domain-containing protein [Desulfobacterales bacterium]
MMVSRIRGGFFAFALLAAASGGLHAETTAFITDSLRLALRAGPAADQKSLGVVESGQTVEIVKTGEEWTLVRSPAGVEGWVQTRFLTEQPPPKLLAARLLEKSRELEARAAALTAENARLREENSSCAARFASLEEEFESFRRDAAEVESLRARLESLQHELAARDDTLRRLGNLPAEFLRPETLYAFLAGAGVLLAGFFLGLYVRRKRRWSSLG